MVDPSQMGGGPPGAGGPPPAGGPPQGPDPMAAMMMAALAKKGKHRGRGGRPKGKHKKRH